MLPAPAGPPATSRVVVLNWVVPDSLATAQQCRVRRRELHQFQAREVHREAVARSTLGVRRAEYSLPDTLPGPGQYLYQVVAESDDPATPPVVLRQQWVSYSRLRPTYSGQVPDGVAFLDLPLGRYPRGAYLTFVITNPTTGRVLHHLALANEPGQAKRGRLYAQPWLEAGVRQVAVAVECRPPHGQATREQLLLPIGLPAH